MRLNRINLGSDATPHSESIVEQDSQTVWYDYCKKLASLGFFCGYVSPAGVDLVGLDEVFNVWCAPVLHFGNLVLVCEYHSGYRVYQVLYPGVEASKYYYYGFDSEGYLQFVWCSDTDVFYSVHVAKVSMQEIKETLYQLVSLGLTCDLEFIDKYFRYPAVNRSSGMNDDYHITSPQNLKSYRDCPLYVDPVGRVHDIMRGYCNTSFGRVATPWLRTDLRNEIVTAAHTDYRNTCCFLQCKNSKQAHTLFPVLFSDCMFSKTNSTDYFAAFIGDTTTAIRNIHSFVVYAACIAMAYNIDPPVYSADGVHSFSVGYARELAEDLVERFKDIGVKVTQTGTWEFKVCLGVDGALAGGYEPS